MKGWFITGTDTGVGKTLVTAALCRAGRQRGHNWLPAKPVQTGAPGPRSPDLDLCLSAASLTLPETLYNLLNPVRLPTPASPHFAAELAGQTLTLDPLLASLRQAAGHADALLVEGAGGIRVPLNHHHDLRDLMSALRLPVILVARPSLGTLNHTRLSIDSLLAASLTPAAIVLTPRNFRDPIEDNNHATLTRLYPRLPLINLPLLPFPLSAPQALDPLGDLLYEALC